MEIAMLVLSMQKMLQAVPGRQLYSYAQWVKACIKKCNWLSTLLECIVYMYVRYICTDKEGHMIKM